MIAFIYKLLFFYCSAFLFVFINVDLIFQRFALIFMLHVVAPYSAASVCRH